MDAIRVGAPSLQSLIIAAHFGFNPELDFEAAPLLKELEFGIGRFYLRTPHNVLWNITLLHLYTSRVGTIDNYLDWIDHCPSLMILSLELGDNPSSLRQLPSGPAEVRILQCLVELRLAYLSSPNTMTLLSFLPYIQAPVLQSFFLDFSEDDRLDFLTSPELPNFIRRSRPPLRTLSLYGDSDESSTQSILGMLEMVPSVEILLLGGCFVSEVFVQNVVSYEPSASEGLPNRLICPRLRRLHVGCDYRHFPEDVIIDLIVSRCKQDRFTQTQDGRTVPSLIPVLVALEEILVLKRRSNPRNFERIRSHKGVADSISRGLTFNVRSTSE